MVADKLASSNRHYGRCTGIANDHPPAETEPVLNPNMMSKRVLVSKSRESFRKAFTLKDILLITYN